MDDPGGVFASDEHRRVLAWIAEGRDNPLSLAVEMTKHDVTKESWSEETIGDVLLDLEADGYASCADKKWTRTAKGTKALKA